jgi:hypothetical protein
MMNEVMKTELGMLSFNQKIIEKREKWSKDLQTMVATHVPRQAVIYLVYLKRKRGKTEEEECHK